MSARSLFASFGLLALAAIGSDAAERQKEAFVNYIGWFPSGYRAPGLMATHDFPVVEVEDSYARSIKIMRDYGWTAILPDTLFFDEKQVAGQTGIMDMTLKTIRELGYKDFKAAPFLELKSPEVTEKGIDSMLGKLGSSPEWLRIKGRPLVFIYDTVFPADKWSEISKSLKAGANPYLIGPPGCSGLQAALFGTFDAEKSKPYLGTFEGLYNFGASGLEKCSETMPNAKKALGSAHGEISFCPPVWPGYLSTRTDNKNFNSPRGTEFFRHTWEAALSCDPDFIHMSTWNDWCEATTQCPSYSVLTSRLEISQRYLCRFFGKPLPEGSAEKPETVLSYRKCIYQGEALKFEFLPLPTRKGPASGSFCVKLSDDAGKTLAEVESPVMSFKEMKPWNWQYDAGVSRKSTMTVKVKAFVKPEGKGRIEYFNLPDIAVSYPLSYADQLYYSLPLHKLAPADKGVSVRINKSSAPVVETDGFIALSYEPKGAGSELQVATSRDGHAQRLLAPINSRGAEMNADEHEGGVKLAALKPGDSELYCDWGLSDGNGQDYFAAVASFPDGTWAYSPTVWSVPAIDRDELAAQWIFMAPSPKPADAIRDRSGNGHDIKLQEPKDWKFVKLPGNGRALSFNGKTNRLKVEPNGVLPNGPVTLECVLRYEKTGKPQTIAYQRGAQAALVIDADGYLKGLRLPEFRASEKPFVELKSKEPLTPGAFHEIVLVFDGKELSLHLDGKLQEAKPCEGTRSSEGFFIGGPFPGSEEVSLAVDGIGQDAFFKGELVRLSLYSRDLNGPEIKDIFARFAAQPFVQNAKE